MITRIDFIGMVVIGHNTRSHQTYKPSEWPGWTAAIEGSDVVLRGPSGVEAHVPRSRCVIYTDGKPLPSKEQRR